MTNKLGVGLAVAVALLASGCSAASKEAPPAPSSAAPSVSPTEKGAIAKPPKAFSQTMNTADGKSALESQGYNVQIQWGLGRQDKPLSACTISAVDGLRGDSPPAGTTVYLTVNCP